MVQTSNKITAYLSLGSNMDDRLVFLGKAIKQIEQNPEILITNKSKIYETEPWPKYELDSNHPKTEKGQKWFLNQVIKIVTTLNPSGLLKTVEKVEKEIGRTKKHTWGPRRIDIDILLYGNEIIELKNLVIPHRHMYDREFVLIPLLEIEPKIKDPSSGKPFSWFLKNIKDKHKVETYL